MNFHANFLRDKFFGLYIKGDSICHIRKLNAYKILLLVFNSRFFFSEKKIHSQYTKYEILFLEYGQFIHGKYEKYIVILNVKFK